MNGRNVACDAVPGECLFSIECKRSNALAGHHPRNGNDNKLICFCSSVAPRDARRSAVRVHSLVPAIVASPLARPAPSAVIKCARPKNGWRLNDLYNQIFSPAGRHLSLALGGENGNGHRGEHQTHTLPSAVTMAMNYICRNHSIRIGFGSPFVSSPLGRLDAD